MRTQTFGGKAFDVCNYMFLAIFALVTVLPFVYVIAGSLASDEEITSRVFFLIPEHVTWNAYRYIFSTNALPRSFLISVYVTVFGTLINLFFTTTMAYSLSRRDLVGRNLILNLIIFSMVFSGGMIPTYLVIRSLGMLNTLWAMMIPGAISAFNLIIVKNFFQELPQPLIEAAKIDGCSDLGVFLRIVLPLSKPALATFALFYGVGHWNDFYSALLYINDSSKWPLQMLLQQVVMSSQMSIGDPSLAMDPTFTQPPGDSIKMAVIVVSTLPMLMVYPFLQKHFAKGVLIGAIKQ
ncbi:protein LplC [Alicyclobacillus cellulosilyticus]|uniref:Protein LplC n=1 Tax=Alicyclobacillus cellulosilyticus TaxID=1003997 RepID=A0A917NH03_9BACL|nr:carbohydrate ABC transporter permease [Alicyclobacillus cellulosilyticus]GGJ00420.1 protein LplC [Alicyclobacillus cellulosilyticus]